MDTQGAEAARPWALRAGATFPTVVDRDNTLAALYGYKLIPNGLFLDEEGIIRYRKFGGFNVDNAADVGAIQRLINGDGAPEAPDARDAPYHLSAPEQALVDAQMRRGTAAFARGERAAAATAWTQALHLDPENLTIRKQIWMARYPERFHPTIDFDWQTGQLREERAAEVAAGICGPDGCPVPWSAASGSAT